MKKILIVEDDQLVGNIYRNRFSVDGFQVELARDGSAGLDILRAFRPDAVILDLLLPEVSGLEVIKHIRSDPSLRTLPIIVFSNTYLTNLVQEAWKAGATRCLSKSTCTPRQMIEVVRTALGMNGAKTTAPSAPAESEGWAPKPVGHAPTTHSSPGGASADSDDVFQESLRDTFVKEFPARIGHLRLLLKGLVKTDEKAVQVRQLQEMFNRIRALAGSAGLAGMARIAQMSEALEALLKDLYEKHARINASTLRSVASAVDFLGALCEQGPLPEDPKAAPPAVLVVDDEPISRRALSYALEKAKLDVTIVENSAAGYDLLTTKRYDLVFLDVEMAGMNGFELCAKLRQLPDYSKTPVIFVTILNGIDSRTNSMISGGNDFIAKPFLFTEVAVKALLYLLRARPLAAQ